MTGRTAHSDLWRGILRDVTGCEILVTEEADTCCIGAAMLASVGAGIRSSLPEAAEQMTRIAVRDLPQAEGVAFYNEKYRRYRELADDGFDKGRES